jgi:hypothetical protein
MKMDIAIVLFGIISAISFTVVHAQDLSDVDRDTKALELFLQDKQDHKDYCPGIRWAQPKIKIYKETLKSHLPEDCK